MCYQLFTTDQSDTVYSVLYTLYTLDSVYSLAVQVQVSCTIGVLNHIDASH